MIRMILIKCVRPRTVAKNKKKLSPGTTIHYKNGDAPERVASLIGKNVMGRKTFLTVDERGSKTRHSK